MAPLNKYDIYSPELQLYQKCIIRRNNEGSPEIMSSETLMILARIICIIASVMQEA